MISNQRQIPIRKLPDDSNQEMIWNHKPTNKGNKSDDDSGPHSVPLHTIFPVRNILSDPKQTDNDSGLKRIPIQNIFRSESPDDSCREIN